MLQQACVRRRPPQDDLVQNVGGVEVERPQPRLLLGNESQSPASLTHSHVCQPGHPQATFARDQGFLTAGWLGAQGESQVGVMWPFMPSSGTFLSSIG